MYFPGVQLTTSPIAQGYRNLCQAMIIFALVALRLLVIFEDHAQRKTKNSFRWLPPLDTSVALLYSSKVKYNSEKIAHKLKVVFVKGLQYSAKQGL